MTPPVQPVQQDPLVEAIREFQRVNNRLPSDDEAERMARILEAPAKPGLVDIAAAPAEFVRRKLEELEPGPPSPEQRAGEFAATFAPSATAVPVPAPIRELIPLREEGTTETFDDFLKRSERIATGELPSTASLIPQLGIRPLVGFEAFAAGLPKPLREVESFSRFAIKNPLDAAAGLVSLPYHLTSQALRSLDPANIRSAGGPGITYDIYARMTPDEADEARRALGAFVVSLGVAGPASTFGAGFARALGAGIKTQRFLATQAGAVAAGATFGLIEAPPGDKQDRAIAYGLLALPIGFAFKVMRSLYNVGISDAAGADVLAKAQSVRPFDGSPRTGPRAEPVDASAAANEAEAAALSAEAFKQAEAFALTRGEEIRQIAPQGIEVTGVRPTPEAPGEVSFFQQLHPSIRDFPAPKRELVERRAERLRQTGLPEEALAPELAAAASLNEPLIKTQNLIRSGKDLVNGIILNFRDLKDKQMAVVRGVENPGEPLAIARQVLPKDMVVAVHRRPDGMFDVALGRPDSPLARRDGRTQFATQGFVEGEAVFVDGKVYKYVNAAPGDRVKVVDIGVGKELTVERSQVRRGPESSFTEFNSAGRDLLKQALDERELKIYDKMFDALNKDGKLPEPSTTRAAASNGLFVDRDNAGGHLVRDSQTGEVLFRTQWQSEALGFVNRAGQRIGPDFTFGSDVPPEIINSIMPPPDQPPPLNSPSDLPPRGRTAKFVDWLNAVMPRTTAMRDWMASIDNLHGTEFTTRVYIPTQNAMQARMANARVFYEKLKKIEETTEGLTPEERLAISDYREAMSPTEVQKKLFLHRELNGNEVNAGRFLAERNVDIAKVYKFQRRRDESIFLRARKEGIPASELPVEMRREEVNSLAREMGMTQDEISATTLFDSIKRADLEDMSLYGITRFANALMSGTVSRAEFAARNKLTPKQIRIAQEVDKLYKDAAAAFGIDDARLIEGYMNHYMSLAYHGAITSESSFMWQRSRRLQGEVPRERQFLSEMIRTGEITAYTRDPIMAAFKYISAGFAAKDFTPVWDRARAAAREMINELPQRRREIVARVVHDTYLNELRGIPDAAVQFTQDATEQLFKNLEMNIAPDVRRQIVNTVLATVNSAALGFRPALGIRDVADFVVRYGSLYGFDRAANGLSLAMEKGVTTQMRNKGLLPGALSPVEFSTAEELFKSNFGKHLARLPDYLNKIAEKGLTVSLQRNVYEIMHAAAYLDTRQVALRELSKLAKGEIDKAKAFRDVKAYTYDPPIIRQFERIIDSGEVEAAADFIARETSRKIGFVYGQANHPYGWGTNIGRLLGQFGTWSVWTRNFVARGLTQGTRADRAAFAARFAMSQSAIWLTGKALGFNLYSWYLFPGLFFAGGPAVQTGMLVADLASPFETDRRIAKSRLLFMMPTINSPGSLFIPGSYMLGDLHKAFTQAENLVEFGGRAIGIPLRQGSSWIDEF